MDAGRGGGWGVTQGSSSIGASLVFKVVQMLDSDLVASCGLTWDLLIALFMSPLAEGIGWVMNESPRPKVNGGCHVSMR